MRHPGSHQHRCTPTSPGPSGAPKLGCVWLPLGSGLYPAPDHAPSIRPLPSRHGSGRVFARLGQKPRGSLHRGNLEDADARSSAVSVDQSDLRCANPKEPTLSSSFGNQGFDSERCLWRSVVGSFSLFFSLRGGKAFISQKYVQPV